MFKLLCGQISAVALGGYTCADVAAGHCLTGCQPSGQFAQGRNRCQCNYPPAGYCSDQEVCSCASVPVGKCMTGCEPSGPFSDHRNQCQCNYDNAICPTWRPEIYVCPAPIVASMTIDFDLLYSQDGRSSGQWHWERKVTVGSSSTSSFSTRIQHESTSTASIESTVSEGADSFHVSGEEKEFMQTVAESAASSTQTSEMTETWEATFNLDKPAYLYQGKVTYYLSDGSQITSNAQRYHVSSTRLPVSSLHWHRWAEQAELPALANSTHALQIPDVVIDMANQTDIGSREMLGFVDDQSVVAV